MNPSSNDSDQRGVGLYVITLASSNLPMPLDVPFRHELIGFTVFRSRSFAGGRERFRLHLGYFDSARHANEALTVVRKYYPAAEISVAPDRNLSSLDDTLNTEFRLLRTAYARVVTPASATPAPTPVAAQVVASTKVEGATVTTESRAAATDDPSLQHYAVQLEWSLAPIVATDVPRLAIFKAHHLYTVRVPRQGIPQHGLRLGFFTNPAVARRVAEYVRPKFPAVGVVPVSHREYLRAIEVARQRGLTAIVRGSAPSTGATTQEPEVGLAPARTSGPVLPEKLKSDDWRNW